ncbi:MAG: phosphoribosyltransferase family protein [Algoriphagus sp.]|uniref:phosphoribosyltransferase family protein n=1 Tax=Algoriphagus sp. TaxID=1872435 RepID=UPI00262199F5|nr:phosphoribosyltransferase family protein [Algoriphagus sp.]MDG1276472.1 phosphoribosyltransferase family protein [Algoriphagus sp.]
MNLSYSHHKIYKADSCPFSEAEYSWFKFGDTQYAEKFAIELFEGFIAVHGDLILSKSDIVILPSPYFSIPTASNFLCAYFKKALNQFLFENDKKACTESKIHRNQTYTQDYGSMSFEERIQLISKDTYYLDKNFIEGKYCIFLDDIKITGSHELVVQNTLQHSNFKDDHIFVYFAELCNKSIHPNIENHFNYFSVKGVFEIIDTIKRDTFRFNTRIVKYILKMDEYELSIVIDKISDSILIKLLHLAISNNYHQIPEYQKNINILNQKPWQLIFKKDNEKPSMLQNSLLA